MRLARPYYSGQLSDGPSSGCLVYTTNLAPVLLPLSMPMGRRRLGFEEGEARITLVHVSCACAICIRLQRRRTNAAIMIQKVYRGHRSRKR